MTMQIEARNVRLSYGDVTALDGLSMSLEGNRIIGLLGRNGSGKSTLLSALAAFRKQDEGEVLVNGGPVWENPAVTSQIALIREGGDVIDEDEPFKDAMAYAEWLRPNWNADLAEELIERFSISRTTKVSAMSRGQRSAVGIVLGLAARAPITMFDETYLGMDAPSRYAFYDVLLKEYMAHPRMMILSTHLIEEVSSVFEDVVIIDKGKVLLHEATDDLLGRGTSVTGSATAVNQFVEGMTVIGSRELGRTRSAMVFGDLTSGQRRAARQAGLDLDPIDLQDLFVHLTAPKGAAA